VLTNFLNYVEIHNVFPEYEKNLVAAKHIVQKARHELITNRSPHRPLLERTLTRDRKLSNVLPGTFNKLCSTYFGGYYKGLYDHSSDEEFEDRFTHRKAMTHLRRARGQSFLADHKVGEWSFPCEVVRVEEGCMVLKQWIPEAGEEDHVEPRFKDTEVKIWLEEEVLKFAYVYFLCAGMWRLILGGCILRGRGINFCRGRGIWIKLPYHSALEIC
jgi:hypothetical protein